MGLCALEVKYEILNIKISSRDLYEILNKFFDASSQTTIFPVDSGHIEEILREDESSREEMIHRKLEYGEVSEFTAKERKILKTLKRMADKRGGCFDIAIC